MVAAGPAAAAAGLHWPPHADVAELVDAHGSGPCARKGVEVQVLSSALEFSLQMPPFALSRGHDWTTPGQRTMRLRGGERGVAPPPRLYESFLRAARRWTSLGVRFHDAAAGHIPGDLGLFGSGDSFEGYVRTRGEED